MILVEKYLHGDVLILSLAVPRLDAVNSGDVLQAVLSHLSETAPRVVLDLEQVGYLSSAGLRAIVQTARHVKGSGGRLALCGARPSVSEIIAISGFDSMLPVLPTRAEAMGAW